jgi:hypothetical protein
MNVDLAQRWNARDLRQEQQAATLWTELFVF